MARRIKVAVTEEDIRKGKSSPCDCPIARAIKRVQKKYVEVRNYTARVGLSVYCLPKKAQIFVLKFDQKLKVRPIEFELI